MLPKTIDGNAPFFRPLEADIKGEVAQAHPHFEQKRPKETTTNGRAMTPIRDGRGHWIPLDLPEMVIACEIATLHWIAHRCHPKFQTMPRIQQIIDALEALAPPALQEDYDNSGLLVGEPQGNVEKVLVSLDVTEEVVAEAKARGAGLIVSHHPILFRPLKRITGKNQVERTIMAALRAGVGLYAIHTNLGQRGAWGERHDVPEVGTGAACGCLRPEWAGTLSQGGDLCAAGRRLNAVRRRDARAAGGRRNRRITTSAASDRQGTGTFRALEAGGIRTCVGEPRCSGTSESEETAIGDDRGRALECGARGGGHARSAHPYEEVAHDVLLHGQPAHPTAGKRRGWGQLPKSPWNWEAFVARKVKSAFGAPADAPHGTAKRADPNGRPCAVGTGSFLLADASSGAGADVFLSSDFKYHEFFGAEGRIDHCRHRPCRGRRRHL